MKYSKKITEIEKVAGIMLLSSTGYEPIQTLMKSDAIFQLLVKKITISISQSIYFIKRISVSMVNTELLNLVYWPVTSVQSMQIEKMKYRFAYFWTVLG